MCITGPISLTHSLQCTIMISVEDVLKNKSVYIAHACPYYLEPSDFALRFQIVLAPPNQCLATCCKYSQYSSETWIGTNRKTNELILIPVGMLFASSAFMQACMQLSLIDGNNKILPTCHSSIALYLRCFNGAPWAGNWMTYLTMIHAPGQIRAHSSQLVLNCPFTLQGIHNA